jgi:uncharacterized protein
MSIKVIIEEDQQINFEDSVFITGFHGIGWTGYIAIRHLIKTAKAERIGYLIGDVIPDIISIEDEHLVLPFEFYKYKDFVIFQPPIQPILIEQGKIIQKLAQWIVDSKFKEAVLVGGLDIRFQQDSNELRLVPTKAFIDIGKQFDNPYLEKGLLIRGPLALLLTQLEVKHFPAVVILPFAKSDRPDPAAAAVAIEFLNKYYQLDISTSQLQTDAQMIEDEIAELLRQERERTEREPHDMYI